MAKTGRPKKVISKTEFEKLCKIQCTMLEICAFFDISEKTLEAWCKEEYGATFSIVFEQKKEKGKVSLRRIQWQHAEKNPGMAMFLGKNILGQRDRMDVGMNMHVEDDPITKALKESGIIDGA